MLDLLNGADTLGDPLEYALSWAKPAANTIVQMAGIRLETLLLPGSKRLSHLDNVIIMARARRRRENGRSQSQPKNLHSYRRKLPLHKVQPQ